MGQDLAVESAPVTTAAGGGAHGERLSSLVTSARATVDRETGLALYRDMTLGRRFEDKCAEMYYRGKMFGFVHLYNGQEAVSTVVIGAMKRQHDCFCSTYRDHVHSLSAGVPARQVMSELFGKETGCSKGRGGSMHLFSKSTISSAASPLSLREFQSLSALPSPVATNAMRSEMTQAMR